MVCAGLVNLMEVQRMDQLKQVPGFRRWKKDRKDFIRILLVMSLSFFLMEFGFMMSESV